MLGFGGNYPLPCLCDPCPFKPRPRSPSGHMLIEAVPVGQPSQPDLHASGPYSNRDSQLTGSPHSFLARPFVIERDLCFALTHKRPRGGITVPREREDSSPPGRWPRRSRAWCCTADRSAIQCVCTPWEAEVKGHYHEASRQRCQ